MFVDDLRAAVEANPDGLQIGGLEDLVEIRRLIDRIEGGWSATLVECDKRGDAQAVSGLTMSNYLARARSNNGITTAPNFGSRRSIRRTVSSTISEVLTTPDRIAAAVSIADHHRKSSGIGIRPQSTHPSTISPQTAFFQASRIFGMSRTPTNRPAP